MTLSREAHLVELVNDTGNPIGECTVDDAHRPPGRLHRAFSVFLVDPTGRVLLQQRAAVKTRFPLRWANSCCGHPAPGQSLAEAANRRLGEELGIPPVDLTEVGVYVYYAEDPATGRVEFEYDHVLRADLPPGTTLAPAPEEVADVRWVTREELLTGLAEQPRQHAPWLAGVTDRLFSPGRAGADGIVVPGSGATIDEAPERSGGR